MTDNNNEERFYLFTSTTALYTIDATTVRQPEWNTKKGLSCLSIREIHDQTLRELGPLQQTRRRDSTDGRRRMSGPALKNKTFQPYYYQRRIAIPTTAILGAPKTLEKIENRVHHYYRSSRLATTMRVCVSFSTTTASNSTTDTPIFTSSSSASKLAHLQGNPTSIRRDTTF